MSVRVLVGDAIERLRELPADSVHCCVTSPPYWGLRDYGVDGQIGLEPTPEEWCAKLVEMFREVRRVLRPDGVCFVNVGDSYAGGGHKHANDVKGDHLTGGGLRSWGEHRQTTAATAGVSGLKPKDLIGAPWTLAFALRADGWWLRSDTVWNKPNPMPESISGWQWEPHRVRDPETGKLVKCPGCPKCEPNDGLVLARDAWRPTKAHEYVFMLGKSETYYADQEAVREANSETPGAQAWRQIRDSSKEHKAATLKANGFGAGQDGPRTPNPAGRNVRSVWTIATEPYAEAHFATFPTELAARCILAGTSAKGCCPECGAPWARVVEREGADLRDEHLGRERVRNIGGRIDGYTRLPAGGVINGGTVTAGWRPTCTCPPAEPIPATVLDPFGGSGTTGLVADRLSRDAILIELSPEYAQMAERRIARERARRAIGVVERTPILPGQASLFGDAA